MFTPEEITNFVNAKRNVKLLFQKRNDNWNGVVFLGPGLDKMLVGKSYTDNSASETIIALPPWLTQYESICEQHSATNVALEVVDVAVINGWTGLGIGSSLKAVRLSNSNKLIVAYSTELGSSDDEDDYVENIKDFLRKSGSLVPAFIVNDTLYITEPYFNEIKTRIGSKKS